MIALAPRAAPLLAALCLAAGCAQPAPSLEQLAYEANDHLAAVLRAEVDDSIRVQRALTVAERIRFAEEYYFEEQRELDQRLFELNAEYEATRERFYALFEEIHELRGEARDELVALYQELKGHVSAEEWQRVVEETQVSRDRLAEVLQ